MAAPTAAEIARTYQQALREARVRGIGLARDAQTRLAAAISAAASTIEFDLTPFRDRPLTDADAATLRAQLDQVIQTLERRTVTIVATTATATVQAAVETHQRTVADLFSLAGLAFSAVLAAAFAGLTSRVLAVLGLRRGASVVALMRGHVAEADPQLDLFLAAAVRHGISIQQVTRDLAHLLSGAVPVDLRPYGLTPSDLTGFSTLRADGRMVAVSESFNSIREVNAQSMIASPIVRAAKWTLSPAHVPLDTCDIIAQEDFYGIGAGLYPLERWPVAPHPNCACLPGPLLLWPVHQWGADHPTPPMQIDLRSYDLGNAVTGTDRWSPLKAARTRSSLQASLFDILGRRGRRSG